MFLTLLIVLCFAILLAKLFTSQIPIHNQLEILRENLRLAYANLGVIQNKKNSLTNQLLGITLGYSNHEQMTHLSISENTMSITGTTRSHQNSGQILREVNRMALHFPELKADRIYLQLIKSLSTLEDDLQTQCEEYNQAVYKYNSFLKQFPLRLYANKIGFPIATYMDIESLSSFISLQE